MLTNYNAEIEAALADIGAPVAFMFYEGNKDTYITYCQAFNDNCLAADDEVIAYVTHYDIDVYSKGNYLALLNNIKNAMIAAGFTFQPSNCSPDQYERDTKLFHKTLSFAKESEV